MLMQLPRVIYYGAACKQNYRIMLCFVISWWCRVVIVREKKKKRRLLTKQFVTCDLQVTTGRNDKGLKLYDPGYLNTAPVRSSICYIDGDEGILRYRGYPIEELAENSSFVEVAYLLSEYFPAV